MGNPNEAPRPVPHEQTELRCTAGHQHNLHALQAQYDQLLAADVDAMAPEEQVCHTVELSRIATELEGAQLGAVGAALEQVPEVVPTLPDGAAAMAEGVGPVPDGAAQAEDVQNMGRVHGT